jgi:hypothetical protein
MVCPHDQPAGCGTSRALNEGITPVDNAVPAKRGRRSWWPMGVGAASLGTPVGIGILHPMLGEVIAGIEVAAMLVIIGTALFGSSALSERAFRLLRWLGNRPEPPSPAPGDPVHAP